MSPKKIALWGVIVALVALIGVLLVVPKNGSNPATSSDGSPGSPGTKVTSQLLAPQEGRGVVVEFSTNT